MRLTSGISLSRKTKAKADRGQGGGDPVDRCDGVDDGSGDLGLHFGRQLGKGLRTKLRSAAKGRSRIAKPRQKALRKQRAKDRDAQRPAGLAHQDAGSGGGAHRFSRDGVLHGGGHDREDAAHAKADHQQRKAEHHGAGVALQQGQQKHADTQQGHPDHRQDPVFARACPYTARPASRLSGCRRSSGSASGPNRSAWRPWRSADRSAGR